MPSQTFHSVDGWQTWNVPKGVDRVAVDVQGAGSGSSEGGRVQGQIRVNGDQVLYLMVGEAGNAPSGHNGGASARGGGGGGGDGSLGRSGGYSGGGASSIRLNSTDGTIKVVAAGAGGASGDTGQGGNGGGTTGQAGFLGTGGAGQAGNATGGTQLQGGDGGTSSAGAGLGGGNGDESQTLGRGGHGGQQVSQVTYGGGGGGGGYRAGGGGCASLIGVAPGGGGGGGSNYTGGVFTGLLTGQGTGGTGAGVIVLTWTTPSPANQPPGPPGQIKVDGVPESSGMGTKSTGAITVSGIPLDPDATTIPPDPHKPGTPSTQLHSKARLTIRYSSSKTFSHSATVHSDYVDHGKRASVRITGLAQNTHYYLRVYAQDPQGLLSTTYNSVDLWTNRSPREPTLQSPADNATILVTDTVTYNWNSNDPDPNDRQSAFEVRWRLAATATSKPGKWSTHTRESSFDNFTVDPGAYKGGLYYDWTVRTRDGQQAWGPYAAPRSFGVIGPATPPKLLHPIDSQAVDASEPVTVRWRFRDPGQGASQTKADLRYRVVGTEDWVTVIGDPDPDAPGSIGFWTLPVDTFTERQHYEWEMRTYHSTDPIPSDWSDPEDFWTHAALGHKGVAPIPEVIQDQGSLGCGTHRAYIYDRGGEVMRGEVTPLVQVSYTRQRDDVGSATIVTNGFGDDCGDLLKHTHSWLNELVIFRDGVRVFEGPITLIEDSVDGFSIQAKDVMGYVYRRILRQGYNDTYHIVDNVVEGLISVVQRAGLIIANALAPDDPNVLPYLTLMQYDDDARQSRIVPDWSKTAWEEVDDMAANAGLDYSIIGRRIILNDTHRPVGRLPELRSANFSDPPKITEYGMLLADLYAVTDNAGHWGAVRRPGSPYGGVELLVSSFSSADATAATNLTKQQTEELRKTLVEQARRGIASRYPAPYIVRVPDNSNLSPDTPLGINQLVPGVWIPLRAQGTVVEISQWQKLDVVTVTEVSGAETVGVTMSPAPNQGQDPDSEVVAGETQ